MICTGWWFLHNIFIYCTNKIKIKTLNYIFFVYSFYLSRFFRKWSCYNYWENITVPIVFINATDDPIVPPKLVEKARSFVLQEKTTKTKDSDKDDYVIKDRMLIEQKYGGHLGFHEGGFLNPNTLTWLDRLEISYI